MKNKEKYRHELLKPTENFCSVFVIPNILKSYGIDCCAVGCNQCKTIIALWLEEEYKEPQIDWSKVPVDTKIYVGHHIDKVTYKRYFAKFENGTVYAFVSGGTSWTCPKDNLLSWEYARLAEVEE